MPRLIVLKSARSVAFMSVSPAPMRRPAGQPVRGSADLAWQSTLESQAATAALEMSAVCERQISCEYLGQRHGPAHRACYRKSPSEWKVKPGEKASRVALYFRCTVVGSPELEPVLTVQRNHDVRVRRVSFPDSLSGFTAVAACSVWCARALQALESAANEFVGLHGPQLQEEFGQQLVCTYKYQTETQHRDPKQWVVPSDGRRSHCKVTFEIGFVGGMSVSTEARYNDIVSNGRFIPLPQQFLTRLRKRKAEAKAAEATKTSGCPCRLRGWVGQEEGEEITTETKLSYEWCSIRTVAGQPYTVQIRYRDLITQGRPVPNCPMRLAGRPGLVYSVAFFEQFAANICPGLEFCGLVYEGSSLTLQK